MRQNTPQIMRQQPNFIECYSPYRELKVPMVNPDWLNQLPPGQPANGCLCPQQARPAPRQPRLVMLYNQSNYIISYIIGYVSVIKL